MAEATGTELTNDNKGILSKIKVGLESKLRISDKSS